MPGPINALLIAELFDRHCAALEFYAAQWTTSPQDCVQEAFVQLAQQASPPDDPRAWLFRVVRNQALNAVRAERRRTAREQSVAERQAAPQSATGDPADTAALSDLLRTLTERQHELVVLRVWGRLTWQEIAEVAGGSRSAAQRDYVEALQILRKILEPSSCPTNEPSGPLSTRHCPTN
jgi:RNA polymerase sigma factor (sigma-70 family)